MLHRDRRRRRRAVGGTGRGTVGRRLPAHLAGRPGPPARHRHHRSLRSSAVPANFASDNVAPAAPPVMAALAAANSGAAMPYGNDTWSERLAARLASVFERAPAEIAVFPVATGTAANALALSLLSPPWGAIYCHPDSHAQVDECGAPEFWTGGAKLVSVDGAHGRIDPAALDAAIAAATPHGVHNVQPAALTVTQASEAGTVYTPEDVARLAGVARR
ncbi:MAG: hypothetical protein FJX53_09600, partial [Alphaproteobacteria bacterium]|nr:hypothetical protein [Alphaproteobacteria bacterium]